MANLAFNRVNIYNYTQMNIKCRHLSIFQIKYTLLNNRNTTKTPNNFPTKFILYPKHFSLYSSFESFAITQQKLFKTLSESTPVGLAQDYFLTVHELTGLPWWATIMLVTMITRSIVTVPLSLYQNYIMAKVENVALEMPDIVKELKQETAVAIHKFNLTEKQARVIYNRSLKKQWNQLILRENCHPFKATVLLWIQLPMWICLSVSLRNLVYMLPVADSNAQITFAELTIGGFAWIPNLTMVDNSLILPIMLGVINLLIIEVHSATRIKEKTKFQKFITNVFRVLSVAMVPLAANVPSCMSLYWVSSSTFGLIQNFIMLSPTVKQIFHIPKSASQLENPYKHLMNEFKRKLKI